MFKLPMPVLEVLLQRTAQSRLQNIKGEGKDYSKELIDFLSENCAGHDTRDVIAALYWVSLFLLDTSMTEVIEDLPEDSPIKQGAMKELAMLNLMDVDGGDEH